MAGEWIRSNEFKMIEYGSHTVDLHCPRCGVNNLHHGAVTVFDRGEDASKTITTTVDAGRVSVNPHDKGAGNPSRRRDGLVVRFSCEGCGDDPIELTIAQHKGSTEIGWRYVEV